MKKQDKGLAAFISHNSTRLMLLLYDTIIFLVISGVFLTLSPMRLSLSAGQVAMHMAVSYIVLVLFRIMLNVYRQIWRYGGIQCYIRLLISDACTLVAYEVLNLSPVLTKIGLSNVVAIICVNCLCSLAMRMSYRYFYKTGRHPALIRIFSLGMTETSKHTDEQKIKVAIVGAGTVGVNLAEDLLNNPKSVYTPRCFIETDISKVGRQIHDLPVLREDEDTLVKLRQHEVQEIIVAVSQFDQTSQKRLYEYYRNAGFKVKIYDYPTMQSANGKRSLREFDIEDLLFRKTVKVTNNETVNYYKDKVVLITGGGGSIGSELCRQIAKMGPKQIVILDVYENGAYEVQQELKIAYGDKLDVRIVIVSVCNRVGLERAFGQYRPQIVINAAAHKHVPLMEDDCIEAVENNVFGTLNTVEVAEEYGVERLIMVSTDKAVNPTNVMGATKRMCEMIVLSHKGKMTCSATRFGNVLGSAGSVIPLFKKQIAVGGPVTITDKRIIRYFMTIPEAAQLVLQSGAMAKNKELFVLDMGQPVKILELAENMIRLSGQDDVKIVEMGLRPGEKLYEELLVKTEELDKTDNELIFIERDHPLDAQEIDEKLATLRDAVATNDNAVVKAAMKKVVPTYKDPKDVNAKGIKKEEVMA